MRPDEAYAEVGRITRTRARNFAYGIMLLPRPKRQAIAAIYAFARRVDDIADGELPLVEKRARLEELGAALERDPGEDATLVALADARVRYTVPGAALQALVAGGLQDTEQRRYASFDELHGYCRKVAGAVGVACVPVYGAGGGDAAELGEELGVALQLINILRDVAEDWRLGRVYIPLDELARFGVSEDDIATRPRHAAVARAGRVPGRPGALVAGRRLRAARPARPAQPTLRRDLRRHLRRDPGRDRGTRLRRLRAGRPAVRAREAPHRGPGAAAVRAVVVGGGLAGLAAALELADAGHEVTLLEARPTLGGAVQTLPGRDGDPEPPPDNGQHIALGCFTEYLAFLARIGKSAGVRRTSLALPVIDEAGRAAAIRPGLGSLLRYSHVSFRERIGVLRALVRMRWMEAEPGGSFGDLLHGLGQSPRSIDRFWDVFVRPALNLRAAEASAELGLMTVRTALLGPRGSSDLVLPLEPLGDLHGRAAGQALESAGASVRTGARAVELDGDSVVLADGERVAGDTFVVALPPAESAHLLGEAPPELEDSPIVSVHLLFDRRLLRHELAALLASPAHWVFDRGRLTGHEPERGQYLTVVSSGAPELLTLRGRELVEAMRSALTERLGPAELLWSRVSREPAATFAPVPGSEAARRPARTARPDVVRAGAWTATGWPATMEGAIRSGRTAARIVAVQA